MRTITVNQAATIKSLIASRTLDASLTAAVDAARAATMAGTFPFDAASILIDTLIRAPRRTASAPALGTYRTASGDVIRIVSNREKTRRYGKRWNDDSESWEYVPGLGRLVAGLVPLSLAEAEEFGVRTGQCAICGRTLTVKASIDRGIGPKCAKMF